MNTGAYEPYTGANALVMSSETARSLDLVGEAQMDSNGIGKKPHIALAEN